MFVIFCISSGIEFVSNLMIMNLFNIGTVIHELSLPDYAI